MYGTDIYQRIVKLAEGVSLEAALALAERRPFTEGYYARLAGMNSTANWRAGADRSAWRRGWLQADNFKARQAREQQVKSRRRDEKRGQVD